MNILELPFNQHVGLTIDQRDGQEVIRLEADQRHANHLGTIHAGAIFCLAEAASGHALLNLGDFRPEEVTAVLRSADVKYRKPAEGRLFARACVEDDAPSKLAQQLEKKGRAFIDVQIRVQTNDNAEVFAGTFTWFVSRVSTR